MSGEGLVTLLSAFSVSETIDRLVDIIESHGLKVFARVDHAGNALQAGMQLRPTELLIFGHPKGGTPLMQDQQTAGIDLPVKALAWEADDRKVWLTYNNANWLAERHGLGPNSRAAVEAIEAGMLGVTKTAAGSKES